MRALWDCTAANGLQREWLSAGELREREPNITGLGGILRPFQRHRQLPRSGGGNGEELRSERRNDRHNAEVSALKEHASGVATPHPPGRRIRGLDADCLFGLDGRFGGKNARRRPRVYHLPVPRRVFPAGTAAQPDRQPFDLSDSRSGDAVPRRPPDPHDSTAASPSARNAVLALKREGYRKRDISLADTLEILTSPGIRRVLQNNLRSGLGEMKNSLCRSGYLRLVQNTARA